MFLCCGDCLFDVFAAPTDASDVSMVALSGRVGGSAFNVALGLARLGQPSAFLTKMSDDVFGERIQMFMEIEGIDRRFLVPTTRNTTLALVSLSADGTPRYKFLIEGTADRSVEPSDVPASFPDELKAIHFGGSYSTIKEPTASALLHLLAQERGRRLISYDPNIRASVEPDLEIWRGRVERLVPFASLVKASDEDLGLLYPGRAHGEILADWIGAGVRMAVVTRGDKGAMALTSGGVEISVPGRAVTVVDTVGAGDTFQAALLTKLAEDGMLSPAALARMGRGELDALLGFAVGAASVTVTRRGADLPRRADLGLAPLP